MHQSGHLTDHQVAGLVVDPDHHVHLDNQVGEIFGPRRHLLEELQKHLAASLEIGIDYNLTSLRNAVSHVLSRVSAFFDQAKLAELFYTILDVWQIVAVQQSADLGNTFPGSIHVNHVKDRCLRSAEVVLAHRSQAIAAPSGKGCAEVPGGVFEFDKFGLIVSVGRAFARLIAVGGLVVGMCHIEFNSVRRLLCEGRW